MIDITPENVVDKAEEARQQRLTYGVSEPDAWALENHFLAVIHNGLRVLLKNLHGWPDQTGLSYDDWVELLEQAAEDSHTLYHREDLERVVKDSFDHHRITHNLEEFLESRHVKFTSHDPRSPEQIAAEKAALKEFWKDIEARKKRLFAFLEEWLWALWD